MSAIHWIEIPVSDIQRAKKFYDTVLSVDITIMDLTESQGGMLGTLPQRGGVSGALVENSKYEYIPSKEGALVYLVVDDLDTALESVEGAGGVILLPKTGLGEMDPGFTAWIEDSEGNRVSLYGK